MLEQEQEPAPTRMIDVSHKPASLRSAAARGEVRLSAQTLELIRNNRIPKGQVLEVARVAAIMAAKDACRIIPLCHPVRIDAVRVDFSLRERPAALLIEVLVKGVDRTGVEMEALTAVAAAALAVYDMCKVVDERMIIAEIRLLRKKKETPAA